MAAQTQDGGNREFREFLRAAPSLDDASSGAHTELTGLVSRTGEAGKFAITTGDGKTYELEVGAVQKFRTDAGSGLTPVATIQVASEVLKNATLRTVKPIIKDMIKDPIKDVIHDGTLHGKDIHTDPIVDKPIHKDIHTDPLADKHLHTDPLVDKHPLKDIHKDPLQDPINTGFADLATTGAGDPVNIPDPAGQVTNPAVAAGFAAQAGGVTPFVMATPHQAPQHLVAMQAGMPQTAALGAAAQLKPLHYDTAKEVAWAETIKEPIRDTLKELIHDTRKELIFETVYEPIYDPTQVQQPGPMFGMPGFM
jgi:hypothetical protein